MANDTYLATARKVLERAEQGHGTARIDKPCSACAHYDDGFLGLRYSPVCRHPVVKLAASQSDDEDGMEYLQECKEQRSKKSIWGAAVCGPDAALFEE